MARVDVTEVAAEKAKTLLANSEYPAGALRVRVVNGGCSGMRYELLFDDDLGLGDEETRQFGLRVFVDSESAEYLEGCRVDFSDELNDSGFKIENPAASTTCGCGESFNVV
ncbi:MAG: iron-sulfur cluster assembly accessory protein [Myxococcota bacterium]